MTMTTPTDRALTAPCDDTGCFVYQLLDRVSVRSTPLTDINNRTGQSLSAGDRVAVDLIRHAGTLACVTGPFLRLADGAGWIAEYHQGRRLAEPCDVHTGQWTFYADNYPSGIALRNHPMDGNCFWTPATTILPMRRISCDRHVAGPGGVVNYYRVQGLTNAWVLDRRVKQGSLDVVVMMMRAAQVETGLVCYRALAHLAIRNQTNVSDDSMTACLIRAGELITADVVRQSPQPTRQDGPFLRLTDGSGWLFAWKDGTKCMEEIHIQRGSWQLQVVNAEGIQLRKHPIDDTDVRFDTIYDLHERVVCDRRIDSPSGVRFYRVTDTEGWVFDKRGGGKRMMQVMALHAPSTMSLEGKEEGWSPDFVRGVSIGVEGLEEIAFQPKARLLSFRHAAHKGVKIHVYYSTRTVGTAVDQAFLGTTQVVRRGCTAAELAHIFKHPKVPTNTSSPPRKNLSLRHEDDLPSATGGAISAEDELRCSLVECEEEIAKLQLKRMDLLKPLLARDAERAEKAADMRDKEDRHRFFLDAKQRKILTSSDRTTLLTSSGRSLYTMEHDCAVCGKRFKTNYKLEQHRDAVDHW
jgi:hypothetical protein